MKRCKLRNFYQYYILLAFCLLITSNTYAARETFQDETFDDSDWTVYVPSSGDIGGHGTVNAYQVESGGNPGEYRVIKNNLNGEGNLCGFHMKEGAIFDPSIHGVIVSIDFSQDWILIDGYRQSTGLALIQDGIYYQSTPFHETYDTTWTTNTVTSLVAEDFVTYLPSDDQHPDFSIYGSPTTFGFFRENYQIPAQTTVTGIDNWSVTIKFFPFIFYAPSCFILGLDQKVLQSPE